MTPLIKKRNYSTKEHYSMKGYRFRKKLEEKTMRDQYALSSNETVNIIAVGDFHIGS